MKEYTITKIARYTTNKDGQPLKTKDGRPYTSLRLQVAEHGQSWISGFGNAENANWREGDKVSLTITEKGGANGVIYLNFATPKGEDKQNEKIEQILNGITSIKLCLAVIQESLLTAEQKQERAKMRKDAETEQKGYEYPDLAEEPNFEPPY